MICRNYEDVEPVDLGNGVSLRWLTHKDLGGEEYLHNHNLRYFAIGPGVSIDLHDHKFIEIMYILRGNLLFSAVDKDGDQTDYEVGPGDYVYTYSCETHGLRNQGTEPAVILCFSDCVDGKENCTKK